MQDMVHHHHINFQTFARYAMPSRLRKPCKLILKSQQKKFALRAGIAVSIKELNLYTQNFRASRGMPSRLRN